MQLYQEDGRLVAKFEQSEDENIKAYSISVVAPAGEKGDITGKKKATKDIKIKGLEETANNTSGYTKHVTTSRTI